MCLPPRSVWLTPRLLQYAPDVHPPPRCEICRPDTMVTSVRSWCYACQVLVLQRHDGSGVGDDDPVHEQPRFPYKPWKRRLPRSYNKVGDILGGILWYPVIYIDVRLPYKSNIFLFKIARNTTNFQLVDSAVTFNNNNIIDYIKSTNRLRQWFVCYLLYVFNCSFSLPMAHLHFAVVNECDRNVNVLYVFWAYYYILI